MWWITGQSNIPGEQLAQSILNADSLHTMQLIVFMVTLGWVIATWLNGRAVAQMSQTQNSMGRSNEKFFEADAKRTAVMQAQLDESRRMRESYETSQSAHQAGLEAVAQASRLHEEKAESRMQTLINHTSTLATAQTKEMSDTVTDRLDEATVAINKATEAALEVAGKPALEAIGELKELTKSVQMLQKEQMSLMKRQQDAQMDALKELFDAQMQIINTQIDRTENHLLLAINLGRTTNNEEHIEVREPVHTGIPSAGAVEFAALVDASDGAAGSD